MGSRWVVNQRESTWFSFGELVLLARSGELQPDDLVKADWELEWHPARTVVGLFYRAKQTEPSQPTEPEPARSEDAGISIHDLEASQDLQPAESAADSVPVNTGWQKRLREVQEAKSVDVSVDSSTASNSESMQRLIAETLVAKAEPSRWARRFDRWKAVGASLYEWLHSTTAIRLVGGSIVAVLAGWAFYHSARQTALRFPREDMPDRLVVPFAGDCTPGEFAFLLCDLVIGLMLLVYFGGSVIERWLESRARWSQEVQ